ncbi:VOC family protein [Rubellimicrobium roseum]|uniref:VOC family protein n=1 Tax=Rubellimicrobium roseum TaxID=687525 RepID=A0A5C4N9A7_9RHOB|nr:VOC family protein [Rubellimicrobium roseum]TNC71421.1 VOC family protein [Rubellimicrobium roseum]
MVDRLGSDEVVLRPVEALDRARSFLRDRLGLPELLVRPSVACFALPGARLILRETGRREAADLLYFGVADILSAHEVLSRQGVAFQGPPELRERRPDGAEEWVAYFEDDEGRTLALHATLSVRQVPH